MSDPNEISIPFQTLELRLAPPEPTDEEEIERLSQRAKEL